MESKVPAPPPVPMPPSHLPLKLPSQSSPMGLAPSPGIAVPTPSPLLPPMSSQQEMLKKVSSQYPSSRLSSRAMTPPLMLHLDPPTAPSPSAMTGPMKSAGGRPSKAANSASSDLASSQSSQAPVTQPPASQNFDAEHGIERPEREDKGELEDVFSETDLQREMAKVRDGLRASVSSSHRPDQPASSTAIERLWHVENVLDRTTVVSLAEKVLNPLEIKLKADTLQLLSEGIQEQLKNIVEAAIGRSRKRRNKSAAATYFNIRSGLQMTKGVPGPLSQQNLAMKCGPDIRSLFFYEETSARAIVREAISREEERLKEELRAFDEEYSKKSKSKDKSDTLEQAWWEKDTAEEASGVLNWEQLSAAHRRDAVARKYQLGPYGQKKRKAEPDDGPTVIPKSSKETIHANETKTEPQEWRASNFPLYTKDEDILNKDDVLTCILKVAKPSGGGRFSNSVGISAMRARLEFASK